MRRTAQSRHDCACLAASCLHLSHCSKRPGRGACPSTAEQTAPGGHLPQRGRAQQAAALVVLARPPPAPVQQAGQARGVARVRLQRAPLALRALPCLRLAERRAQAGQAADQGCAQQRGQPVHLVARLQGAPQSEQCTRAGSAGRARAGLSRCTCPHARLPLFRRTTAGGADQAAAGGKQGL